MNDNIYEALCDLRHDLAKYIRMPIAWLSEEAGQEELRSALELALFKTRVHAGSTTTAREIWERFLVDQRASLSQYHGFESLTESVEKALNWAHALDKSDLLDRGTILADFEHVAGTIRSLIEEVKDE